MLEKAGVKSTFIDGLRVTDAATMEVAEMVLSGVHQQGNRSPDQSRRPPGGCAGGWLCCPAQDAWLITVEKTTKTKRDPDSNIEHIVDLGFVGEPKKVDPKIVEALIYADDDYVPVIAPIGVSVEGDTYNINADTVAGAVAGALKAKHACCSPTWRACWTRTDN